MSLTKPQINKILKDQNQRIDRILETFDDKRGTNYLCEKIVKIKVKAEKIKVPIDHFNYNALDEDEDEEDSELHSNIRLEIPPDFFNDKSQFFGLYKMEVRPITKKLKKADRPVWHLLDESIPHCSFEIGELDVPGAKEIVSGRNNPYSYYTMFKTIKPFIPFVRFGLHKPYLVSNTSYKVRKGDEFEILFYDYLVLLTDDIHNTNYLLLTR